MIYLLLAILSSTFVSLIMRISEQHTDPGKRQSMLAVNYAVCVALAMLYGGQNSIAWQNGSGYSYGFGFINGFLYLAGFVLLQINIRLNGVVLPATFMRLGVLVPTALSIVLFGEHPSLTQTLGFIIAVAAIIGINTEKKTDSIVGFKAGLILLLLSGGTADAMSKVYDELGRPELSDQFLIVTFVSALLFCLILLLIRHQKFGVPEVLFGVLIAIPNYYSARFLLGAVTRLPAVVVYPSYSVGTIVTISLAGFFLFHEKISRRQKLAMGGILIALILLNI